MVSQQGDGLQVAIFDNGYNLQGWANNYETCAVTWQHLDTGPGTLVLPETHSMASALLQAGVGAVVPIRVTWRNFVWTGRVDSLSIDSGDGSTQAVPGMGTITATLIDDWPWIDRLYASPGGSSSSMTGLPDNDTRTGPLVTIAKRFIADAATRLGLPLAVTPTIAPDTSPTVTLTARWTKLTDLLVPTLQANNYTMTAATWIPGDPQPLGMLLTTPTVVIDIAQGSDSPTLIWRDQTFQSRKLTAQAPASVSAILAGAGSGTDQTFTYYTDPVLRAAQGAYGFPESYFSASSATTGQTANQDAQAQLAATEGGVAVAATIQDGVPWTFGQDYSVGDIGYVDLSSFGLPLLPQQVVSVQLTDDRQGGLLVVPTLGDTQTALTTYQKLYRRVRSLGTRVSALETGA